MPNRLNGLKIVSQAGRVAIKKWFETNLLGLRCDDLLTAGFNCPCQACHAEQYSSFKAAVESIGQQTLSVIISEVFRGAPIISIENAKVALVIQQWLEGVDLGSRISPLDHHAPALQAILVSLSQEKLDKLYSYGIYRNGLINFTEVVSALRFFGIGELGIDKSISSWSYPEVIARLQRFVDQLESPKPDLDKCLPFDQRWQRFLDEEQYQFIQCYFDLKQDRNDLLNAIAQSPQALEIADAIPVGKVAWKRIKKRVLYCADNDGGG